MLKLPSPGIEPPTLASWCLSATHLAEESTLWLDAWHSVDFAFKIGYTDVNVWTWWAYKVRYTFSEQSTSSFHWFPPEKARLPPLEVGREMNIVIQNFKMLNDLAPMYLRKLIETRCRKRQFKTFRKYPENSSHEEGATWNKFLLLFGSKNLELFVRGIENNQRPQNCQRWPASTFFYLIEIIIDLGPSTKWYDIVFNYWSMPTVFHNF